MMIGRIKQFVVEYDEHVVSMGKVHETYSLITTDLIFVSHEDIDANENIINFQNGLLNITTMELLPHTSDELSTIQIPCNWIGHPLPTPVFDGFMNTLTSGNQGEILFVNQFGGVCISNVPGHRMKKAIFQIGKGNTGKTLLISLIQMFLGRENYISIDLRELEARFGAGTLYGKRLAGCSDMSFIRVTELKAFKMCTGGDPIFVEFKGENGFTYRYRGILWFCANQLPKFSGDDGEWVYDRIAPLFCNNVIPPEKRDKLLLEKMYAEREGIIYKFVMALKMVIAN
ncbi:phage/plasmid primase, P4 family, partial [Methanobrevibacter sp.]|uniref:DNA primase family protein n=1 Tax=Methanobrevibacter sp. TaxID=66852 RepID=UPI00386698DF